METVKVGLVARVRFLRNHFGPTWAQVLNDAIKHTHAHPETWDMFNFIVIVIMLMPRLLVRSVLACKRPVLTVVSIKAMALGATPTHIQTTAVHLAEMADEVLFR